MKDEAELRRKINENLQYVYSGQAARDAEARKDAVRAVREQRKLDKRRIKSIERRIPKLEAERDELQRFLDELLEAAEPSMSADEVDHALEGCVLELGDLRDELAILQQKDYGL